jgi:hypothetical protein
MGGRILEGGMDQGGQDGIRGEGKMTGIRLGLGRGFGTLD